MLARSVLGRAGWRIGAEGSCPRCRRIQAFIDRRFYRRNYDASLTLQQFAQTARDEVDLEQLRDVLLHTVNETMQPEWAGLWLRSGEDV